MSSVGMTSVHRRERRLARRRSACFALRARPKIGHLPTRNGYVEQVNETFRHELFNAYVFQAHSMRPGGERSGGSINTITVGCTHHSEISSR